MRVPISQYPRPPTSGRASVGSAVGENPSARVTPPAWSWLIWVADCTVTELGPAENRFSANGAVAAAVCGVPAAAWFSALDSVAAYCAGGRTAGAVVPAPARHSAGHVTPPLPDG